MSSISDPNVREVIAKETLTYKPKERHNPEQEAKNVKALENLIEVSQNLKVETWQPCKIYAFGKYFEVIMVSCCHVRFDMSNTFPSQIGHSAFHKLGRLEDEWAFVLPILIKRIVAQYADLRQYKKDSLCMVEKKRRQ